MGVTCKVKFLVGLAGHEKSYAKGEIVEDFPLAKALRYEKKYLLVILETPEPEFRETRESKQQARMQKPKKRGRPRKKKTDEGA